MFKLSSPEQEEKNSKLRDAAKAMVVADWGGEVAIPLNDDGSFASGRDPRWERWRKFRHEVERAMHKAVRLHGNTPYLEALRKAK